MIVSPLGHYPSPQIELTPTDGSLSLDKIYAHFERPATSVAEDEDE